MKTDEYREHLLAKGVPEADAAAQIQVICAFELGLAELGTDASRAGKKEIDRYAARMIADESNSLENFEILCEYALWLGQRALYVALLEVTDCHNGMATLADTIEAKYGVEMRTQIFREPPPPLGADEAQRCAYTRAVTERMAALLTKQEARAAWFTVQHGIPASYWSRSDDADRKKFAQCGGIDAFLDLKRRERNEMLQRLHDRGELWYTMEMTGEVLDFVTGDLHMEVGQHNGAGIIVTKVPYQPARWLHETDGRLKRYYACHCPLVREAILRGEPITDDVCYCSLGHASHYLAGLGLTLRGEVLQSAVRGDERCRFIFYLPDDTSGA